MARAYPHRHTTSDVASLVLAAVGFTVGLAFGQGSAEAYPLHRATCATQDARYYFSNGGSINWTQHLKDLVVAEANKWRNPKGADGVKLTTVVKDSNGFSVRLESSGSAGVTSCVNTGHDPDPVDIARLSPLTHDHINFHGRYQFHLPDPAANGDLRPLTTTTPTP